MQMASDGRRFVKRADEVVVDVVHLDRREPETLQAGHLAGLADQARQAIPGGSVPKATEIDPRQDDLAVSLLDTASNLAEHGFGGAAAAPAPDERNHAEIAGEA